MSIVSLLLIAVLAEAQQSTVIPFPRSMVDSKIEQTVGEYLPMGLKDTVPLETCPRSLTIKKSDTAGCFLVSGIAKDGAALPEAGLCLRNYNQEIPAFGFWNRFSFAKDKKVLIQNEAQFATFDSQRSQTTVVREEKVILSDSEYDLSTVLTLYEPSTNKQFFDLNYSSTFLKADNVGEFRLLYTFCPMKRK